MSRKTKRLRVCELFAGVGGFRLGLRENDFETVWSNQWEPNDQNQFAYNCYIHHFPKGTNVNDDIAKVKGTIPTHDLLVGGFPCQDYSVATAKAKGIHGKKGVLWWEIVDILELLKENKPRFLLLENVDRLLRSPTSQRGRDFGIILSCLNKLGYIVEWRMINAADYGLPQKRRRTFIFATNDKKTINYLYDEKTNKEIIEHSGYFAREFKTRIAGQNDLVEAECVKVIDNLVTMTKKFQHHFFNSGYMNNGVVYTVKTTPILTKGKRSTLGDIVDQENVAPTYYLPETDITKWKYCKGAKKEPRKTKEGFVYNYAEGAIPFPDKLDAPSRTMLTSEGGKRPNRITHVIKEPSSGKLRRITPEEAEKLNGFPAGWTSNMPERWRYFCMGNALVVGLIERMGKRLKTIIRKAHQK